MSANAMRDSLEEVRELIREGIAFHIAGLREDGLSVPVLRGLRCPGALSAHRVASTLQTILAAGRVLRVCASCNRRTSHSLRRYHVACADTRGSTRCASLVRPPLRHRTSKGFGLAFEYTHEHFGGSHGHGTSQLPIDDCLLVKAQAKSEFGL